MLAEIDRQVTEAQKNAPKTIKEAISRIGAMSGGDSPVAQAATVDAPVVAQAERPGSGLVRSIKDGLGL